MTIKIVGPEDPAPILAQPFIFSDLAIAEEIANDLLSVVESRNIKSLAAPHVGLPLRVIALHGDPFVIFNPKIVDVGDEQWVFEEDCLVFPGLSVKVKRPKAIRIRYTNYLGETDTHKFTGLTARLILKEMDHLDGKWFFDSANKFHRDQAFRRYKTFLRHPERFVTK